jgi:hypothetical protein
MMYTVKYNSKGTCHMGQDKSIDIIKCNFFWLGIDKYMQDFVSSGESC